MDSSTFFNIGLAAMITIFFGAVVFEAIRQWIDRR